MSKVNWKGSVLLAPIPPVMVTCESPSGEKNVLTIAWTGIINTIPPMTYISIRPQRHSYDMIKDSGVFVINLTTTKMLRACDYCGVKSGDKVNKFDDMNLSFSDAIHVKAPLLDDSPVNLECRVKEIVHLGSHDMFIAEIVSVNVTENLLDSSGKLCLDKAGLLAYSHGEYFELGKKIGTFGFSVKKKKNRNKKSYKP